VEPGAAPLHPLVRIRTLRWLVPAVGIALPVVLEYARTGRVVPLGMLPLLLYLAFPYLVLWGVSWLVRDPRLIVTPFAAMVALQLWTWIGVATGRPGAPIMTLKVPLWQAGLLLPAGVVVGRAWRRRDERVAAGGSVS
jgi:hypothetical protein